MLNRAAVFVAEDEPFIALDLEFAIDDAGGTVIGPAASVAEALLLLADTPVAAAIVDVHLADGHISPILELLIARGIPTIVQSGVGLTAEFSARFPGLLVRMKPCVASHLVEQVAAMIAAKRA